MERQRRPARRRSHPAEPRTHHQLLHRFYTRCAASDLPELHWLATTIQTWWPDILATLTTGITNAGSEGTNRVIKTIAGHAYGLRTQNLRPRTRTATTRRHRRHLNPLNFEEPSLRHMKSD
jgi:transposase